MNSLVIDASVALKWFVEEDGSLKARKLLKDLQRGLLSVYVPQPFFFEVANFVSRRCGADALLVEKSLDLFFSLDFQTEAISAEFIENTVSFARRYGLTAYDASYLALADLYEVPLLTSDRKLKEKVKLPFVKLL